MGLFSSKKKTFVASTAYNLAGDVRDRSQYLQSTVIGAALNNSSNVSIGDALSKATMNGPAMQQRGLFNWAKKNYQMGMSDARIITTPEIDPTAIEAVLPAGTNWIQEIEVEQGDVSYWGEYHVLKNRPAMYAKNWEADTKDDTLIIKYPGEAAQEFPLSDYPPLDPEKMYLYVNYTPVTVGGLGEMEYDDAVLNVTEDALPSVAGYTLVQSNVVPTPQTLTTTTTVTETFSDNRPVEVTTSTSTVTVTVDLDEKIYQRNEYIGRIQEETRTVFSRRYTITIRETFKVNARNSTVVSTRGFNNEEGDPIKVVTETVTRTQSTESLWNFQTSIQRIKNVTYGKQAMFIYPFGSGNAVLDGLIQSQEVGEDEFYPFIPVRLNNRFISESPHEHLLKPSDRLYKKATGKSINELIDVLWDNENLGDIDYAYVNFGISLNVTDNSARAYLFEFFKLLSDNQAHDMLDFMGWQTNAMGFKQKIEEWGDWAGQQANSLKTKYGASEPQRATSRPTAQNSIQIRSKAAWADNYGVTLSWYYISEVTGSGFYAPDLKAGEYRLQNEAPLTYSYKVRALHGEDNYYNRTMNIPRISLIYQKSATEYIQLFIVGLNYSNTVYKGKAVNIGASDALNDKEESGFVIPLHMPTLKKMSLVDQNQIVSANMWLLLNSYKVVKVRWYQRGFFKFAFAIAFVAVALWVTGGAGLAASGGILGANAAVGAALGFTGMAAIIAGVAANAVAGIIVTRIIQEASVAMLGDELGLIVGTIASFAAMQYGNQWMTHGNLSVDWGSLMRPDNLMKITESVSGAYSGLMQLDIQSAITEFSQFQSEYQDQLALIESKTQELLGTGLSIIDPMMFTDVARMGANESSDTFLHRTLLTGSDIADLSQNMIESFSELTLDLPKAFT